MLYRKRATQDNYYLRVPDACGPEIVDFGYWIGSWMTTVLKPLYRYGQ